MITLTTCEVERLTGYRRPGDQLAELQRRGFFRARRSRCTGDVILERAHYDAVCSAGIRAAQEDDLKEFLKEPQAKPLHWRKRPEHQERLRLESELRKAQDQRMAEARKHAAIYAAAYKAARPMRRAALVRHHANKRRVAKIRRTPPWADHEKIREIYDAALKLQAETGIAHHVDHVIPLQGKLVSGLHVENNLQVLPWHENITKRNRFEVEP
jgi:hypothetical protein